MNDDVFYFLKKNGAYLLGANEKQEANLRPFGYAEEIDGKIYFCIANYKEVYSRIAENPNIEICSFAENGEWLLMNGTAVFDNDLSVKEQIIKKAPTMARIYQTADNPIFEVFYLENAYVTMCKSGAMPQRFELARA